MCCKHIHAKSLLDVVASCIYTSRSLSRSQANSFFEIQLSQVAMATLRSVVGVSDRLFDTKGEHEGFGAGKRQCSLCFMRIEYTEPRHKFLMA